VNCWDLPTANLLSAGWMAIDASTLAAAELLALVLSLPPPPQPDSPAITSNNSA